MVGTKAKAGRRPKRAKKSDVVEPLVTALDEGKIDAMMERCDELRGELRFLTIRLLMEQKQRAHERRMAALKQLGSAVAYAPVALVKGAAGVGRGLVGALKRRFVTARPQEASSS